MGVNSAPQLSYTRLSQSDAESPSESAEVDLHPGNRVCSACGRPTTTSSSDAQLHSKTLIACLLCTLFNCLVVLFLRKTGNTNNFSFLSTTDVTRDNYDTLRRPSPFIGLENITRPHPPSPRSIINYPQTVALVDANVPTLVFDDDPLRYMSHTGTVSPEEKKVQVTNSVSTIVQFRAIDFGMELCELNLRTPAETIPAPYMLSVYRLSSEYPLNTKVLSYKTRPSRVADLGKVDVIPSSNVSWSRMFTCKWDELLTFEIACFGEDRPGYGVEGETCNMEWWQEQASDDPSQGIFMFQHATL